MPRRLPLLAVVVALLAAAPARAVDSAGLRTSLTKLHARLGPSAGAYVVDLNSGQVLFAHRENLKLAPASNEKLFVTATALLRYGPDGTLDTTLRAGPGAVVDDGGVLRGDLYLVGGGDPTLGDDGLKALAEQLADTGVIRVAGAVIGDESLFDARRGGPDSGFGPDGDLGGWLSALSWRHGRAGGGGPARAAATRLGALLKAADVRYDRRPRAGRLPLAASDLTLATWSSPPMGTLVSMTNVPSENFYAEMLIKGLGARFGTGGTTAAGAQVVRDELAGFDVHPRIVDGSGLSRSDRTSAKEVAALLTRMNGEDVAPVWRGSLPVAGATGTLRKRMRGTAAAGRCQAKTGTLIGVSALSGYCSTTGGREVAFSFLENGVCAVCAKKVEDRMVRSIAKLGG